MTKISRKLMAVLLSLALVVSIVPITALAATTVDSGSLENGVKWSLNSDGVLTVSGKGEIRDFEGDNPPWFEYVEDITSIVVKDGVTGIGDYAFTWAAYAESVTLADSVTYIGERVFYGCVSIESIKLSANLKSIGENAFFSCVSLESITLPDGLEYIGEYVFEECYSLSSVNIPASVEYIGFCSFIDCYSLEQFVADSDNPYFSTDSNGILFNKDKSEILVAPASLSGDYVVPDSVIAIDSYAFINCLELENITVPASVSEIGLYAFIGMGSIKAINVDEANENYSSDENGVLFDKDKMILYYAPVAMTGSYTVPEGVHTIEQWAFVCAEGLTEIIIPDSVQIIGDYAFALTGITEFTIPEAVTSLGEGMLAYTNITEITIPDSVTYIGDGAFSSCQLLESIYFEGDAPATEIDNYGFYIFDEVTATAYYPEDNNTWTDDVKENFGGDITWVVYTPDTFTAGDINCDGAITNTDLVMMARYIVGFDISANIKKYGDMNSDGVITNADLVALARVIVGSGK